MLLNTTSCAILHATYTIGNNRDVVTHARANTNPTTTTSLYVLNIRAIGPAEYWHTDTDTVYERSRLGKRTFHLPRGGEQPFPAAQHLLRVVLAVNEGVGEGSVRSAGGSVIGGVSGRSGGGSGVVGSSGISTNVVFIAAPWASTRADLVTISDRHSEWCVHSTTAFVVSLV